jgi:hypothetical protein
VLVRLVDYFPSQVLRRGTLDSEVEILMNASLPICRSLPL